MKKNPIALFVLTLITWTAYLLPGVDARDMLAYTGEIAPTNISERSFLLPLPSMDLSAVDQVRNHLKSRLDYPVLAEEYRIEGKLIIAVSVNEDGDVQKAWIAEGLHPILDQKVLKVANALKKVNPVVLNGKKRHRNILIPVQFKV